MKIGYFGTPQISAKLLENLLANSGGDKKDWHICYVVTRADKAQKRSKRKIPSPVGQLISKCFSELDIPLFKPENLHEKGFLKQIQGIPVDMLFVFSYGRILSAEILALPAFFSMNLHASLLPELRGASPIQTALQKGFSQTGWTLQKMELSLDTGDIIARTSLLISTQDNTSTLTERMLSSGIQLTRKNLRIINNRNGEIDTRVQNSALASYCGLMKKEKARIPFDLSCWQAHNWIRAHNPWPLSWLPFQSKRLFLLRSEWPEDRSKQCTHKTKEQIGQSCGLDNDEIPNSYKEKSLYLQCSDGILELTELKLEGKNAMSGTDFLNGYIRPMRKKKIDSKWNNVLFADSGESMVSDQKEIE